MLCPNLPYSSTYLFSSFYYSITPLSYTLFTFLRYFNLNPNISSPPSPPPLLFFSSSLVLAALAYTDEVYLKRPEDVLRAVSVLLANELCLEPSIRHAAKVRTCVCVWGGSFVCTCVLVCVSQSMCVRMHESGVCAVWMDVLK